MAECVAVLKRPPETKGFAETRGHQTKGPANSGIPYGPVDSDARVGRTVVAPGGPRWICTLRDIGVSDEVRCTVGFLRTQHRLCPASFERV